MGQDGSGGRQKAANFDVRSEVGIAVAANPDIKRRTSQTRRGVSTALGSDSMDNFRDGRPQSPLSALWIDPPNDLAHPAQTLPQAIPSCSANLNAVLYQASGRGPHPTALLLRGLPGNEQNLDCAQTLRRSGCNVLTIHYRGSWGNPGVFTIANCLGDAAAALEWLRNPANGRALRIDRQRLVVIGHSMGGFVAAHLASENVGLLGRRLRDRIRCWRRRTCFPNRGRQCRVQRWSPHPRRHITREVGGRGPMQRASVEPAELRLPPRGTPSIYRDCRRWFVVQEATYSQTPSWPSTGETLHAHTSPRITATQHAGSSFSPDCCCGLTRCSAAGRSQTSSI
jgi:hypothetical protein